MYRRYYDGYARIKPDKDSGEVIVPQSTVENLSEKEDKTSLASDDVSITSCTDNKRNSLFSGKFETDDLILIGLLIFLLTQSDNDDPTLLIIIAFIFLGDFL